MSLRGPDRSESAKTFNRRALLLSAAGLTAFGGIATRLYQLQVVESEQYSTLSKDNQFNHRPVPPSRGRILDRFGLVIADNDQSWEVRVTPDQLRQQDREQVLGLLARLIDPADQRQGRAAEARQTARLERWRRAIRRARRYDEVTLESGLDWAAFARVNLHRPDLPGVHADVAETRSYGLKAANDDSRHDADAFAHVIGYVSKPNEEIIQNRLDDLSNDQERAAAVRVLRHPGFRVGRSGVESTLDRQLQGEWGELRFEVDAYGRSIREIGLDQDARPGGEVRLTLDAELQVFAQRRLEGESAAVVAMDVNTGEILCLASAPGFNPNRFARGIETPAYRALVNDPRKPLFNKPLAGLYPPGSTFKMLTALAALRHGIIDPTERVFCNGKMRMGDRTFHCWKDEGHGAMDMRDGIKRSCDVYFYEIARRFERKFGRGSVDGLFERGVDAIAQEARAFGLGPAYPIAAPGGRDGIVPTAAWKRARFNEPWAGGETLNVSIGQGFLSTSPLQLAVMTSRLANGGRPVTPYLLADGSDREAWSEDVRIADEAHLSVVLDGMFAVTEEWGGTAFVRLGQKGLDVGGMQMAGKTGTSQVRRITRQERLTGVLENDELPWRFRDHALFVGFAPYHAPRYAVVTVVEHGGSGSSAAAPPAGDILRWLVRRDLERPSAELPGERA